MAEPELMETLAQLDGGVVHIAGPADEDGVQRCLRCDVVIFGLFKVGQLVLVEGEEPIRTIAKKDGRRVEHLRCVYPTSRWLPTVTASDGT